MFEQSLIAEMPGRRPWPMLASISLQFAVLALLLLLPLVYLEQLPNLARANPLFETTRAAAGATSILPKQAVKLARVPVALMMREGVLIAPLRIPPKPVMIDDGDLRSVDYGVQGVIGGIDLPEGLRNGVVGAIANLAGRFAPPDPPPAVEKPQASAATPPPPTRIRLGGVVQDAKIIRRVVPLYPPLARQARISGTVKLQGIIGIDGRIQQLTVISGHPLLVKAAVDAVNQWLYEPTLLNHNPVEVIAPIEVHFTLSQ